MRDLLKNKKILYGLAVGGAILGITVFFMIRQHQQQETLLTQSEISGESAETAAQAQIKVHVAGAVNAPGLYTLTSDARVIDAIQAAGGMTAEADSNALNLAAVVKDGDKITVRTAAETQTVSEGRSTAGLININTADKQALMELPGIGEVLAQNIITYREAHGGFASIEEIKEVNRIGDKLYEQIKDSITI
jgi:competence protein ComEA